MVSQKSFSRWQKATALVPLALLSGAWTTGLTVTSASGSDASDGRLPDGTSVPGKAVEAPASVSNPGEIAPGVPKGQADKVIAGASANGIPAAALSAYQRAAQVIDKADPSCGIDWTLIAAIGRVESDHGRYGGNTLDSKGVDHPGIYGIPLDGRNGTAKIADTDGGQYDKDVQYDRAVGPMQFIPSTWSVIGVDGDGDGERNPQDIDDAALATAVYLCSGKEDLSGTAGQRVAVYRYNHSNDYVNLVLAIATAYADGDYSSVPTSSGGTTTFTPDYGDSVFASGTQGYTYPQGHGYGSGGSGVGGSGYPASSGGGSSSGTPTATGTPGSTPTTSGSLPTSGGSGSTGGSGSGGGLSGVVGSPGSAVTKITGPLTSAAPTPVKVLVTNAQATALCVKAGVPEGHLSQCVDKLMGKTYAEAQASVGGIVAGIKSVVCGLPLKPPGC